MHTLLRPIVYHRAQSLSEALAGGPGNMAHFASLRNVMMKKAKETAFQIYSKKINHQTRGAAGNLQGFHSSCEQQFEYSNDYIHAPTMYNLTAMQNRKLKFGLMVFGGVGMATILPICAVHFQQKKAAAGGE